jgi:ubiquinone/menaquinone biosynthesis C-methylase UbiE
MYDIQYYEEQEAKIKAALSGFTLEKEGVIVDAGCGTGLLFPHLANRAKLVAGVDFSVSMIKQAKKRMKDYTNTALIRADADFMPFPNGFFDVVFAVTLLQNTPNPLRTLDELKRVAKQNATIIVTGLKKIFSREDFTRLPVSAGLRIKALTFDENLKDYVAICTKSQRKP